MITCESVRTIDMKLTDGGGCSGGESYVGNTELAYKMFQSIITWYIVGTIDH